MGLHGTHVPRPEVDFLTMYPDAGEGLCGCSRRSSRRVPTLVTVIYDEVRRRAEQRGEVGGGQVLLVMVGPQLSRVPMQNCGTIRVCCPRSGTGSASGRNRTLSSPQVRLGGPPGLSGDGCGVC
jgi:hypothetical protein